MSGVASFSPYRSLRCFHATGVSSPTRSRRALTQRAQTGAYGWSLISQPAIDRRPLVEQADKRADQAGLALAALAEQDDVVAGEQRALDLGEDRVVEADDAGKGGSSGGEAVEQVLADLGLDRAVRVDVARSSPRVADRWCGVGGAVAPSYDSRQVSRFSRNSR